MSPEYVAGFFDGEGCVSSIVDPRSGLAYVRLTLSQLDVRPLLLVQDEFGGTLFRRDDGLNLLHITHQDTIRRFIHWVRPHSIVKREQLDLAEQMLDHYGRPGVRASKEDKEARRALHEQLRTLKPNGGID